MLLIRISSDLALLNPDPHANSELDPGEPRWRTKRERKKFGFKMLYAIAGHLKPAFSEGIGIVHSDPKCTYFLVVFA
jgi:hypothetical protein